MALSRRWTEITLVYATGSTRTQFAPLCFENNRLTARESILFLTNYLLTSSQI